MSKTILAEAVTRGIGRPKNDRCLGRLSKASCECLAVRCYLGKCNDAPHRRLASTSKSLAQMNKSPDVDDPTKEAVKSGNSA